MRATRSLWTIFLLLVLLGFSVRLGYGVLRYGGQALSLSESAFINHWDHDALEHVLIARSLLLGRGYIADGVPGIDAKNVRSGGRDAVFKAPLYQVFLAGVFLTSGYSLILLLPLQSLLGGLASGLIGLVAHEAFGRPGIVWFAGIAAAFQPVLVNTASQPYNENLFFALFAAVLWTFARFLATRELRWALGCGILAGLLTLTRETAVPLVGALLLGPLFSIRRRRFLPGLALAAALVILTIAPWSVRNYIALGTVVPVAAQVGTVLGIGNNECVAAESMWTPFWGEDACRSLDRERAALRATFHFRPEHVAVWDDRAYAMLAMRFIGAHPLDYLRLSFRRAWTLLLPFHPRLRQPLALRAAVVLYWLTVIPAGLIGMIWSVRTYREPLTLSLTLVVVVNLLVLIAVYFPPDLRFRVGADLLLGCFAGWAYAQAAGRALGSGTAATCNAKKGIDACGPRRESISGRC